MTVVTVACAAVIFHPLAYSAFSVPNGAYLVQPSSVYRTQTEVHQVYTFAQVRSRSLVPGRILSFRLAQPQNQKQKWFCGSLCSWFLSSGGSFYSIMAGVTSENGVQALPQLLTIKNTIPKCGHKGTPLGDSIMLCWLTTFLMSFPFVF